MSPEKNALAALSGHVGMDHDSTWGTRKLGQQHIFRHASRSTQKH
jgi:hypothetical protein